MWGERGLATVLLAVVITGCGFLEPRPAVLASTCGQWSQLDPKQQLDTADALIPPKWLEVVRERQQLPINTVHGDVILAASGSISKVCDVEQRPGLALLEVVARLYE